MERNGRQQCDSNSDFFAWADSRGWIISVVSPHSITRNRRFCGRQSLIEGPVNRTIGGEEFNLVEVTEDAK